MVYINVIVDDLCVKFLTIYILLFHPLSLLRTDIEKIFLIKYRCCIIQDASKSLYNNDRTIFSIDIWLKKARSDRTILSPKINLTLDRDWSNLNMHFKI